MKIYTRTGDDGRTSVIGGRVDKDDMCVEAYGTIDELNSCVGQTVSLMSDEMFADMKAVLVQIQHELFDCGSDLAFVKKESRQYKVIPKMVEQLETWIDQYEMEAPAVTRFILPGGTAASSSLHVCRTVCRRAERRTVTLSRHHELNQEVSRYLNRLSDFFFTAARAANAREHVSDVEYKRSAEVFRRDS